MAAVSSIIAGVGLALSATGVATSYAGSKQAAEGQEKAERARKKQMQLDVMRRRREAIRESIVARSTALTNATAQGAGEGSGLQGGYGQISQVMGQSLVAGQQNLALGNEIFDANTQTAQGQTVAAFGAGAANIGGVLMDNNVKLSKLGNRAGLWS